MISNLPDDESDYFNTDVMPVLKELHLLAMIYRKLAEKSEVPGEARLMREVSDNIVKLLDPLIVAVSEDDMNN